MPAIDKPFHLEYGKRYVNRVGRVTAPLVKNTIKYCDDHPFYDKSENTCYQENGRWSIEDVDDEEDLIAEYHEPDPSPPVKLPDVVGEIRGLQYALEWIAAKRAGNPKLKAAAWEMLNDMQTAYEAAVARLQDGESINSTSQTDVPAESPDDWVVLRDPNHVIRECDWLNHRANDRWNKFSITAGYKIHNYPDYNFRCRRKDLPPVPVVPKTRTVTLREYRHTEGTAWSSSNWLIESRLTGRTCECEVPE